MGSALLALALFACDDAAPPSPCATVELRTPHPYTLAATREAHEWALLRRQLRDDDLTAPGHTVAWVEARLPDARCLEPRYVLGRVLFEHNFTRADGLGHGLDPRARQTPFQRVEEAGVQAAANACAACHHEGQPAGSGRLVDAAFLHGDGDRPETAERRVPPGLFAMGAVAALAREMTEDLHAQRDALRRGASVALQTRGVGFGTLRRARDGTFDGSEVEGVDADLVVRPFGWKGTHASLHAMVETEFERHLGVQSDALVARGEAAGSGPAEDPDADGARHELSAAALDAVVAYLAAGAIPLDRPPEQVGPLEPSAEGLFAPLTPVYVDEWLEGRARFEALGCATCHRPALPLTTPVFDEANVHVDLAREAESPRLVAGDDGTFGVPLYSDLRRHDLGDANASRTELEGPARAWLTRPLWGLAARQGYMHDGLATTLDEAIARHGGEAAPAAEAFAALEFGAKGALRLFLLSLRPRAVPRVP